MSNSLQDLLNEEAKLSNSGKGQSQRRMDLLDIIRKQRNENYRPVCFGQDDCSTNMLSKCPWRMDCGS